MKMQKLDTVLYCDYGKNKLVYKTVGMNINCQRACCALMYLMARKRSIAVSLGELAASFRFTLKQVSATLRSVEAIEHFPYREIHPRDYLRRMVDMLRIDAGVTERPTLCFSIDPEAKKPTEIRDDLKEKVMKLLSVCETYDSITGRNPVSIACAIVHLAVKSENYDLPLKTMSEKFYLREEHLKKRISELQKQVVDLTTNTVGYIFTTKKCR